MAYGYDKNTDYQKLINQDISIGDYRSAAIHEAQRNEKILGEGATKYQTTSHYADYLPRTEQINSGMDQLAAQKEWSYDKDSDPAYQAVRKEYLREADRQTRDTLGAYAGMTGGVPSTAAVSAAQQAGNYQRAQLADRIPELMQANYSRWANNREMDRADLTTLAGLDMQRAEESRTIQQQALNRALQQWSMLGYADDYVAGILGVPVGTTTADQAYTQWQQTMAERQQTNTEQQQAIANAMDRWAAMGYADESVAGVLGVPVGASTQDAAYREWQQQMTQQDNARDVVMMLIQMGKVPTQAQLDAAGLTLADAQYMASYYRQQQYEAGASSAGSGSRYSYTPKTPQNENPSTDDWSSLSQAELQNRLDAALQQAERMIEQGGSVEAANNYLRTALEKEKTSNLYDWSALASWLLKYYAQNHKDTSPVQSPNPLINNDRQI